MTLRPSRLIFLMLFFLLSACSTTQVQESWRRPGYQVPHPQKVLVVALTATEATRKLVENAYADALADRGITAIPSFTLIADSTRLNREALQPVVKQNGITTVLVTSVRDIKKSKAYQPPTPNPTDNNLFRSINTYYVYSSTGQHESGSYAQLTDYIIETNLFNTADHKLSWSVTTRTSDTGKLKKDIKDVVKAVVAQAGKDKVL